MLAWRIISILAVPLAAAGCLSVWEVREAQRAVAGRSSDCPAAEAGVSRVDLLGSDLPALVDFALTNRPSMVAAVLAVEDARLALAALAADAPLLSSTPWAAPEVSVGGGHSESSASAKFDHLKSRTDGRASAALSLDVLLWDFGRNSARQRAQAERVVAAELACADEGFSIFSEVASAYFTTLEKDTLLEVARTNECEYVEHLKRAEEEFKAGVGRQLDVLRARLDVATARERLVAASNEVVTAGAELMRALGIELPRGCRDDVLARDAGSLERLVVAFPVSVCSADDVFAFARTNAPSMRVKRAELRAASAQVDAAMADLCPSVSASLSLDWTDPLWLWRWGVSGAQSLFTGGRKSAAVDRAVVAMLRADADLGEAEQALSSAVALAIAERDDAHEAFATACESVAAAKENLDLVRRRFDVGEASAVDFTDAVADYVTALGSRVTAYYRGQRAEARLFEVQGSDPRYGVNRSESEGTR